MSTLESLESVHADSSQPHNQKASLLSSFVLWCVLDRFTQSRAFPRTTTPPHFYKQPTNPNPSSSSPLFMRKLEAEVPSRGLHTKLTPAQNLAVVCMYIAHPQIYIGYPYAPVRLWRGCCRLVSSVVVSSCLSPLVFLSLSLVSLPLVTLPTPRLSLLLSSCLSLYTTCKS